MHEFKRTSSTNITDMSTKSDSNVDINFFGKETHHFEYHIIVCIVPLKVIFSSIKINFTLESIISATNAESKTLMSNSNFPLSILCTDGRSENKA